MAAATRKPVVVNYHSLTCEQCNTRHIRPHKHSDGSWYSQSEDPTRPVTPWMHRQWWDGQRRAWRCVCEQGQIFPSRQCKHVTRILPLIEAGLDREPGPVVVEQIGGDLFDDMDAAVTFDVTCDYCDGFGYITRTFYGGKGGEKTTACPRCNSSAPKDAFCVECGAAVEAHEARVELFVYGKEHLYHAACAPDVPDDGGDDEDYAALFERLLVSA